MMFDRFDILGSPTEMDCNSLEDLGLGLGGG